MKNQKGALKRIVCVLAVVMTAVLAGCGSDEPAGISLDVEKLASDMLEQVSFESQLQQVSEERISDFISGEGVQKQIMYMGSGAYADCFGIFNMADEASAKAIEESVQTYLADLEDSFKFYIPEEVEKISDAAVIRKGQYVVFCVTGDRENAQQVIEAGFAAVSEAGNEAVGDETADDEILTGGKNRPAETEKQSSYDAIETDAELVDYGDIVVVGDTAYELYSYTEKTAETYTGYINKTAAELEGQARVYSIIAPLSSGITLPDKFYGEISSSSQKKSLEKLYGKMDSSVAKVNIYDNMMKHRTEDIYFRTDHHWTALGAYYGYEVFCDAKGVSPLPLEGRKTKEFEGFSGSFSKDTGDGTLGSNPDTVKAYYPVSKGTKLEYTKTNGKTYSWWVISDVSDYPADLKYSTFIAGDNPMTVIENKEVADGSSCVVVKESFGNAFVPFLVDHYQTIYIVDYRYWEGKLVDFVKEKGADDLLFVNSLSMTRSDYLTGKLGQIIA